MTVKQFTIGCSHTINLGNYESTRVEAQVVIEIEESEWAPEVSQMAQEDLRKLLEQTWRAQIKARKEMYK